MSDALVALGLVGMGAGTLTYFGAIAPTRDKVVMERHQNLVRGLGAVIYLLSLFALPLAILPQGP